MRHVEVIALRMPRELRAELERERKRVSKTTGTKIKTSALVRAILEEKLFSPRRNSVAARA